MSPAFVSHRDDAESTSLVQCRPRALEVQKRQKTLSERAGEEGERERRTVSPTGRQKRFICECEHLNLCSAAGKSLLLQSVK
ncbi:hypothetical protein JOB18_020340 [Solea senegalensis]|uniref:Uncharacterized protein n=1 Tax=Solea senegalensis TaxID=28829 RepID=A0AAV6QI11_SOLSE|nr:hypothetical protein JOB18_020340 [Solea senegalensis]